MTTADKKTKALCVATRCTSVDQFVATFHRFCGDDQTFFVATMTSRPVGLETPFSIQLADKQPVLRGLCIVLDAWDTPANRYKRPGIRLGIKRLTADSQLVFDRLTAAAKTPALADATPAPGPLPGPPSENAASATLVAAPRAAGTPPLATASPLRSPSLSSRPSSLGPTPASKQPLPSVTQPTPLPPVTQPTPLSSVTQPTPLPPAVRSITPPALPPVLPSLRAPLSPVGGDKSAPASVGGDKSAPASTRTDKSAPASTRTDKSAPASVAPAPPSTAVPSTRVPEPTPTPSAPSHPVARVSSEPTLTSSAPSRRIDRVATEPTAVTPVPRAPAPVTVTRFQVALNVDSQPPPVNDVEFKPVEIIPRYRSEPRIITAPSVADDNATSIDPGTPALIVDRPSPPIDPPRGLPSPRRASPTASSPPPRSLPTPSSPRSVSTFSLRGASPDELDDALPVPELPGAAPIEIASAIGAPDHSAEIALAITAPHPNPVAQRAAGSALVLPANPLHNLSDESLEGFIDCTIYEESGNVFHPGLDDTSWLDVAQPLSPSTVLPPGTVPAMPFTETPSVVVRSIGGTESLAVAPAEAPAWHAEPVDPSFLPPAIVTGVLLATPPTAAERPPTAPAWTDPSVEPRVTVRFTGPTPTVDPPHTDPNPSSFAHGAPPPPSPFTTASPFNPAAPFTTAPPSPFNPAPPFNPAAAASPSPSPFTTAPSPFTTAPSPVAVGAPVDAGPYATLGSGDYTTLGSGDYTSPGRNDYASPGADSYAPPGPDNYAPPGAGVYAPASASPIYPYPHQPPANKLSGTRRVAVIAGTATLAVIIAFSIAKKARGPNPFLPTAPFDSSGSTEPAAAAAPVPPAPAAAPIPPAPAAAVAPIPPAPAGAAPVPTAPAPADTDSDGDDARGNPEEPATKPATATMAGSGPCRLTVATIPAGSFVILDDRPVGSSPITLRTTCDKHKVDITRPRYQRSTKWVTLGADKPAQLDIALSRPIHTVAITSTPPGAEIAVEGRRAGITPATIQLPGFSSTKLTFTKPGFQPVTKKVYSKLADDRVTVKLTR